MPFRKSLLLVMIMCCCLRSFAQQSAYQVTFIDKKGSPSLSNASTFLSQRALARRTAQGLVLDSTDIPVSAQYLDSVLTISGGKLHVTSKWLNMCVILVTDTSNIAALRTRPFITDVKLVGCYYTFLHKNTKVQNNATAQQPLAKTTGNSLYYGRSWIQTTMVNGDYLHDNGYKGQDKIIAILDAGYIGADTHPGLDSLFAAGGYVDVHNFVQDNEQVFGNASHGLSTLSTMAGNWHGSYDSTYVGSAPMAKYALYITEDETSEQPIELDNLLAGAERADSIGADVISISLGYDTFDDPGNDTNCYFPPFDFSTAFDGKSTVAARAVNMATQKGMLVVSSAGNDGVGGPGWPGGNILTPGDADSTLTVGAVTVSRVCPSTSGHGPNAVGRIKPDVCLLGVGVPIFQGAIIVEQDGTSFATPQMAGWAACLWQAAGNNVSPYALRQAINRSADHYNNTGSQIGYGVPDLRQAFQFLGINNIPGTGISSPQWVVAQGDPFIGNVVLKVYVTTVAEVQFILTDISGKSIFTTSKTVYPGWNSNVTLPVPTTMPPGMYILHAISPTQQQVLKLVKG